MMNARPKGECASPVATIRFTEEAVIKCGPPEVMRLVAEKMIRAHRIGEECGLFSVPEVVSFDRTSGELTMQRIRDIRGIRRARFSNEVSVTLMQRLGRALAVLHDGLSLEEGMRVAIPAELDEVGPAVYLHGDLSGENVCVTGGSNPRLVLIDWQLSPRVGGCGNWGTPYFDVAWFVGNLFRKPAYSHVMGVSAAVAATVFIESYLSASKSGATMAGFSRYHDRFREHRMRTQENRLWWPKRLLLAPGFRMWKRFTTRSLGE